jgi:hypothetical protein
MSNLLKNAQQLDAVLVSFAKNLDLPAIEQDGILPVSNDVLFLLKDFLVALTGRQDITVESDRCGLSLVCFHTQEIYGRAGYLKLSATEPGKVYIHLWLNQRGSPNDDSFELVTDEAYSLLELSANKKLVDVLIGHLEGGRNADNSQFFVYPD